MQFEDECECKCDWCNKVTNNIYREKGWIFFDRHGIHVSNPTKTKTDMSMLYCPLVTFELEGETLDFCSIKCFLKWLFLETSANDKDLSTEEREKFMQEILEQNKLKFC